MIFPRWFDLKELLIDLNLLIGSNISRLVPIACMNFGQYLCYHLGVSLRFFTEHRSYQYLKDSTLFVVYSDKNAEIFKSKYSKNWNSWLTHENGPHDIFTHAQ